MEVIAIYARTSVDKSENSTIDQQIKAGVEFSTNNSMKYKVYQDKGISGYKIADDEDKKPFENRPAFTQMIEDIKKGTINAVWVWEHSRISRNQYASAYIFNIFSKYKIRLYVKDKLYDLEDPNTQLLRTMLDAVAQYERQLIVKRTTRGVYNAIDKGNRVYRALFGYRKTIKNKNNNFIWEPVDSEIALIKDWFNRYKEGESLNSIVFSQNSKGNETRSILTRTHHLSRTLQQQVYTGYSLNMKGREYLKKFDNFEIDNLQMLKNPEYWVKSIPYPLELYSIDDWVTVKERLRIYKKKHGKTASRRAGSSLGTGLITCGHCKAKFFYRLQYKNYKGGEKSYPYYFHLAVTDKNCPKNHKSLNFKNLNTILKIFTLYNVVTSDGGTRFLKDRLFQEDIEKKAIKEKLRTLRNNRSKTEKQIEKLKMALTSTDDVGAITVLAKQIDNNETSLIDIDNTIVDTEIELENKQADIEKTQSQLVYYSVKGLLTSFFEKWNIEDQRNHLLKVIDSAIVTDNELKIKSGEFTYVFNMVKNYSFPQDIYQEVLNEVEADIEEQAKKKRKKDIVFNDLMEHILMESAIKGVCKYNAKTKTLRF